MIEKFKQMLEEKNYSKDTIKMYAYAVKKFKADQFNLKFISQELTNEKLKSRTQNAYKRYLIAWLKFNKMYAEIEEIKNIILKKQDVIYRTVATKDEIYALTEIQNSDKENIVKMKLISRLLFEIGIRIAELYKLEFKNDKLYVVGKGNKLRQLFYVEKTLMHYQKYFPNFEIRINKKTIRKWIKIFIGKDFTPHSMRRSFATYMLQNGANAKTVQAQMGHSNIETTFSYLQNDEEYNKKEYQKFFK